jgi:hypothetical protein
MNTLMLLLNDLFIQWMRYLIVIDKRGNPAFHSCTFVKNWSVFSRIGIRRRNIFHYLHTTMEKPVSASNMPASVFVQGGMRYWMNSCEPLDLQIPPSGIDVGVPLHDLLKRWVDDPQFLLEQVHIPDDGGVALAQGIIQGSARAVSDGSYKPGVIGTAVCIIAADAQDKDCLQALNTVPG